MRILILASVFMRPNYQIGAVWNMKQSQAYKRNGADVLVVCPVNRVPWPLSKMPRFKRHTDCPKAHTWNGLEVIYPTWFYPQSLAHPEIGLQLGWLTLRPQLDTIISKFKPDIVHAHFSLPSGNIARKIHERHGIPYALTDQNAWIADTAKNNTNLAKAYKNAYAKAAVPISVTPYMKEKLQQITPNTKFVDVFNGTDPVPQEILNKKRPHDREREFSIFSCGSLNDRKGHQVLIEAFSQTIKATPNARLRIAGIGPMQHKLQHQIDELGISQNVELLGMTPHEQVLQEMVWADCFALISWAEPFATVYLEAMSAGTPLLWTSDGGINAVLSDELHGFCIPPNDVTATAEALAKLSASPQLRKDIGQQNICYFEENLTWDKSVSKLLYHFGNAIAAKA